DEEHQRSQRSPETVHDSSPMSVRHDSTSAVRLGTLFEVDLLDPAQVHLLRPQSTAKVENAIQRRDGGLAGRAIFEHKQRTYCSVIRILRNISNGGDAVQPDTVVVRIL